MDPGWLLSTIAQSTAALVAILGGFVISRVIAEKQERDALVRRWVELSAQNTTIGGRMWALQQKRAVDLAPTAGTGAGAMAAWQWDQDHPEAEVVQWESEALMNAMRSVGASGRDPSTYQVARRAFFALGLLTLLGLVLPVGVLAARPTRIPDWVAIATTVLFIVGLAVLGAVVWRVIDDVRTGLEDVDYPS